MTTKTQYLNRHGEVVLSRWWRTASAKAIQRLVEKTKRQKLREFRERMATRRKVERNAR